MHRRARAIDRDAYIERPRGDDALHRGARERRAVGDDAPIDAVRAAPFHQRHEGLVDEGLAAGELHGESADEALQAVERRRPFVERQFAWIGVGAPATARQALVVAALGRHGLNDMRPRGVEIGFQVHRFAQFLPDTAHAQRNDATQIHHPTLRLAGPKP
jgi:hypothetical protein